MNLLLLNYGDVDNNSAYHILGHARELARKGHDVLVCVNKSLPDGVFQVHDGFRVASHKTVLSLGPKFAGGERADILHVWTPRETIRLFVDKFSDAWSFHALVIHLEDNEAAIFERFTGHSVEAASLEDKEWPKGLIHPVRHRALLNSAQGITIVHRCLEPLVPATLRRQELVPVMDFVLFCSGERKDPLRKQLGIPPLAQVIAFNGNDHAAAALDIRQLYEAVELLIERGRNVVLVRTGHVLPANYEGLQFRPGPRCIEMGFVERALVPEVMRLADLVIQPGDADAFNSFRLPAKVPEYLAMGKPVIIGATNIGGELASARAALVLSHMSPAAMAHAAEQLLDDQAAARKIGACGHRFARDRFDGALVAGQLEDFYRDCLRGR